MLVYWRLIYSQGDSPLSLIHPYLYILHDFSIFVYLLAISPTAHTIKNRQPTQHINTAKIFWETFNLFSPLLSYYSTTIETCKVGGFLSFFVKKLNFSFSKKVPFFCIKMQFFAPSFCVHVCPIDLYTLGVLTFKKKGVLRNALFFIKKWRFFKKTTIF